MAPTAGIDWASEAHEVCVSEEGRANERFSASHDERGIAALAEQLTRLGVARVAIERPDGILVERLLGAGLEVLAIHPNQVKAARARFAVAHGKSDRFDAYVLAELARTDAHRFRALVPDSDETKALRTLTRAREDLVGAKVELANQLSAQLQAFWPGAQIFAALDSPISLAFIERYPSPADAKGLGAGRMAAFLARNSYSGRTDPAELLARMKAAPAGTARATECEARRAVVLGLIAALRPIVTEIAKLTVQIRDGLAAHPDAAIFQPLFRDPKTAICPATLVAEIGDARDRYPTEAALAADAGMSPVALESGKLRVATFRRACDKRLRSAVATLAPHAIRTLGRAWIRVLWRCWRDEVPYDPARHGNFNRLQTAGG